jgi:hypothetical protein
MQKHSDYNSYLTKLKYSKYSNFLNQNANAGINLTILKDLVENDYLKKNQTIYNSEKSNKTAIDIGSYNTFIVKPVDENTTILKTLYNLEASNQITNGTIKNIINNCEITNSKTVSIYSKNSKNIGGFSNLGSNYNCYVFPSNGDNLELIWNEYNENWCVQKYGGFFINL